MIKESIIHRPRNRLVALFAALISLALTLNAQLAMYTINNDGIRSLRAADAFIAGDIAKGFAIEEWPFYSMLLALMQSLSGFDLVTLAYTFSALSYAALAYCFVRIVARFDASLAVQVFALVVISTFPAFSGWRDGIIREHGFWLLLLLGFWSYLEYIDSQRLRYLLVWMLSTALSSAFRVEALALFIIPLILYFPFERGALIKKLLFAYSLPGFVLLLGVLGLMLNPDLLERFKLKIYLVDYLGSFPKRYDEFVQVAKDIPWRTVPSGTRDYLPQILASGLVIALLLTIIKTVSIIHVGAVFIWLRAKMYRVVQHEHFKLWCFYLVVIFAYLLLFMFLRRFVASRYSVAFGLIAAIVLPLAWEQLWQQGISRKLLLGPKITRVIISFIFLLAFVHAIIMPHRYPKQYVHDAAMWLQQKTNGELYTNDNNIAYFARRDFAWDKIQVHDRLHNLQLFDFSAIEWFAVKVESEGEIKLIEDELHRRDIRAVKRKVFTDKRIVDDQVVIYQRLADEKPEPDVRTEAAPELTPFELNPEGMHSVD